MYKFKNSIKIGILFFCFSWIGLAQKSDSKEINRLHKLAQQVTIIRDNWGIAHIYGKTDWPFTSARRPSLSI